MAEEWMRDGACVDMDPELFHSTLFEVSARRICAGCGVRRECLDYALRRSEKFGVWGGKNPRQRQQILLKRSRGSG